MFFCFLYESSSLASLARTKLKRIFAVKVRVVRIINAKTNE